MSVTEKSNKIIVSPFRVEADHPRMSDLLIQCIPGCRLRSAIRSSKGYTNPETGDEIVPTDQARHLGSFPMVPGMQLAVDPAELEYEIFDPLTENQILCEKITKWMKDPERGGQIFQGERTIKGVPTVKGKLDFHRMKSLVREMFWLLDSKEVKIVKGPVPDMEDINELPGRYLLNPGARVSYNQPVYEDDLEAWKNSLSMQGG